MCRLSRTIFRQMPCHDADESDAIDGTLKFSRRPQNILKSQHNIAAIPALGSVTQYRPTLSGFIFIPPP